MHCPRRCNCRRHCHPRHLRHCRHHCRHFRHCCLCRHFVSVVTVDVVVVIIFACRHRRYFNVLFKAQLSLTSGVIILVCRHRRYFNVLFKAQLSLTSGIIILVCRHRRYFNVLIKAKLSLLFWSVAIEYILMLFKSQLLSLSTSFLPVAQTQVWCHI